MVPAFLSKEFIRVSAPAARPDSGVKVHIIFSGQRQTRALLAAAAGFACGLDAQITLLVPQVVPYPLPLDRPPVPIEFTEQAVASLAAHAEIYLCRDRCQAIRAALPPESVVVLARYKWWWPSEQRRMAKILRQDGHRVVILDPRRAAPACQLPVAAQEVARDLSK